MSSKKTKVKQNLVMTSEGIDSDIELPKNFKVNDNLKQQIKNAKAKTDENKN